MIQLIRGSDNAEQARERLMQVFDLTDAQTTYILDMPLRRLTRFSRLELDKERTELQETIAGLDAILADDTLLRKVVADELVGRRQGLRHPPAHDPARLGRAAGVGRGVARGRRRPLLRVPLQQRPAGQDRRRRASG